MAAKMKGIYTRSEDGAPVFKGKWAVSDGLLDRPENAQAFILKMRTEPDDTDTAPGLGIFEPYDGVYDGIFTMKAAAGQEGTVRVREAGVQLQFR